jgi:hypothetical protein
MNYFRPTLDSGGMGIIQSLGTLGKMGKKRQVVQSSTWKNLSKCHIKRPIYYAYPYIES